MSSIGGRNLTTTGYAILCLLAIRPWSTYELAKQMKRSLHHVWPRAESNIYAEPKRLVQAGLAQAEVERVGNRPRTLYTITPKGRRTLERWIATESAPTRVESETLVKVLFGNYGSKDALLENLRAFAAEAEGVVTLFREVAAEYDRGTHPFPDRAHVNSLIFRWISEHARLNVRWAEWAIERVETWPEVAVPADLDTSLAVFREIVEAPMPGRAASTTR